MSRSAAAAPEPAEPLRFGRFELRPREHRLLRDGESVALGGRAFDLLLALAARPGELVTRNELIEAVWPGRVVEENNLSVQVNALRKALGGDVLVTVPGRGYRFVAPVAAACPLPEADAPATPASPASPPRAVGAVGATGATGVPPPPSPPPRTHLPTAQPLLIGRSDDLAALGTLVEQHRLVTVVGPGGMGKTRLAQALMQMRAAGHPHGVCWVELATVTDPAALPAALALALGVEPGGGDATAALARAVGGLRLLLALDNAEHLLDAVATLAQALLDAAPGLHLVVTSQAPLRLALERVYRLGPMAIPQHALPAREARAFAAVALFAERATAADSRFELTDAQVPAVIELCRALDGVALAIELAAARAPTLGIERLREAMADRLRVLTANRDRAAPRRQQTLRAAVEWSHALLGPVERRLFRRLAVLRGGATLDLIEAVAVDAPGDGPLDEWGLLDALDQLVQRSLVDCALDEDGAVARYRLLESPRAHALEQLAASGEAAAVRTRHAHAVLERWSAATEAMRAGTRRVDDWWRDAGAEVDGARDALAWARGLGDDALTLSLACAVMEGLPPALQAERRALAREFRPWIDRVDDPQRRQRALTAIGYCVLDWPAAQESLALARRLGDPPRLYVALLQAAIATPDDPQRHAMERFVDEARALVQPDWPAARLRALARLDASIASNRGDVGRALALTRQRLQMNLAAGDPSPVTHLKLADLELQSGDAPAAIRSCRALEARLAGGRDETPLALARMVRASAHLALDETAAARAALRRVWSALAPVGRQMHALDFEALCAAQERRHEAAALLVGAADAAHAATGEPREPNADTARARCVGLLGAALGTDALDALLAQGRRLAPAEVEALLSTPEGV